MSYMPAAARLNPAGHARAAPALYSSLQEYDLGSYGIYCTDEYYRRGHKTQCKGESELRDSRLHYDTSGGWRAVEFMEDPSGRLMLS